MCWLSREWIDDDADAAAVAAVVAAAGAAVDSTLVAGVAVDGVDAVGAAVAVAADSENWRSTSDRIETGYPGVDCVEVGFGGCAVASVGFLAPSRKHPFPLLLLPSLQHEVSTFFFLFLFQSTTVNESNFDKSKCYSLRITTLLRYILSRKIFLNVNCRSNDRFFFFRRIVCSFFRLKFFKFSILRPASA